MCFGLLNPELMVTRRRLAPNYHADRSSEFEVATICDEAAAAEAAAQNTYISLDDVRIHFTIKTDIRHVQW